MWKWVFQGVRSIRAPYEKPHVPGLSGWANLRGGLSTYSRAEPGLDVARDERCHRLFQNPSKGSFPSIQTKVEELPDRRCNGPRARFQALGRTYGETWWVPLRRGFGSCIAAWRGSVPSGFQGNEGLVAGRIIDDNILTGKMFREDSGACCRSINVFRGLDPEMAVRLLSENVKGCRQRPSPTTGFLGEEWGTPV
jgi:hypothetical protein